MNKEDYVNLKVAKLLEEKGFNEPCDSRHIVYEDGKYKFERYKTFDIQKDIGIVKTKDGCFYDSYPAPTLYEAQKWLRKQGDFVVITPRYSNKYQIIEYEYRIIQYTDLVVDKNRKGKLSPVVYESYEECLNEGILEALKLIYYEI